MTILETQNTLLREKTRGPEGTYHLREAQDHYNSDLRSNNAYFWSNNP